MSPRHWKERVKDILDAIQEIQTFVTDVDFAVFQNDQKTMRAVELDLIIIGEAANMIPEDLQEEYPEIAWQLMRGMRNRLVHTYFSVSPKILWDTIQQDLPPVVEALKTLLDERK
jgi:uncharacterized protein with HEPN domain